MIRLDRIIRRGTLLAGWPRPELETVALDRNPFHRFGTVEELANLAAFLVSDGSGYPNRQPLG